MVVVFFLPIAVNDSAISFHKLKNHETECKEKWTQKSRSYAPKYSNEIKMENARSNEMDW